MGRKALVFLIIAIVSVSILACGNLKSSSFEDEKAAADIKVGMVTDEGGIDDGSFNQEAWEGLERAGEEFGIEINYLESYVEEDYAANIEQFIAEEYDLIICVGYELADVLREEASQNPAQYFAIVDDSSLSDLDNVQSLVFEQEQAAYLVGYVAGMTTKTDKIGLVLGMATPAMNQFGYGYCAGAIDANEDVEIFQASTDSFSDVEAGENAAKKMIKKKADIIFQAAGGTGLGVIQACKDADIWAIGVDSDQSSIAPDTILTSAMKRVDNACYDAVSSILEGEFEAGVKTYTLAEGGVDIAATTDNLDAKVLEAVNQVKEEIISGKIKVPKTEDEFKAQYGSEIYTLGE